MKATALQQHAYHIVKELYAYEKETQANLAKITKLNKATISTVLVELKEQKIVKEVEIESTKTGRPGQLLVINKDYGRSIIVELDEQYTTFSLCKLNGERVDVCVVENHSYIKNEQLFSVIDRFVNQIKEEQVELLGICIAIHGMVDAKNKIVFTPYVTIEAQDLEQVMCERYKCQIIIENEANMKAIGNALHYHQEAYIISVTIGTGVGAGIILHNELYHGEHGFAGEIGHTTVEFNGRPCPCGNKGCLEQYISDRALVDGLEISLESYASQMDEQAIETFVHSLAMALHNTIVLLNPSAILLDSKLVKYRPELQHLLEEAMQSRLDYCKLIFVETQTYKSLLDGAQYLLFHQYFKHLFQIESET